MLSSFKQNGCLLWLWPVFLFYFISFYFIYLFFSWMYLIPSQGRMEVMTWVSGLRYVLECGIPNKSSSSFWFHLYVFFIYLYNNLYVLISFMYCLCIYLFFVVVHFFCFTEMLTCTNTWHKLRMYFLVVQNVLTHIQPKMCIQIFCFYPLCIHPIR